MHDGNIPVAVARIRNLIKISRTHALEPDFLVVAVLCAMMDEIRWEAGDPEVLLSVLVNNLANHGNA